MNRLLLSIVLFLFLMGCFGCRTTRQSAIQHFIQLNRNTEAIQYRSVDSLYRHDLTGEIEWERVEITYTPETLGDTIIPRKSVTRVKRSLRLSNREEQRVIDTLLSTQSHSLCEEEISQVRELRHRSISGKCWAIILILIVLLINKLLKNERELQ